MCCDEHLKILVWLLDITVVAGRLELGNIVTSLVKYGMLVY